MDIQELTPHEARLEIDRLRRDCAEAYQVIGCLAGDFFNDDAVIRAMDNLFAAANGDPRPHEDLLPFELSQPVSTSHKKNNMKIEEYSELALRTASSSDGAFLPSTTKRK